MKFDKFANPQTILAASKMPEHVIQGITDCVNSVTDYLKIRESEQTKRVEIGARRDAAVAAIQAQKEMLLSVIQGTYNERALLIHENFKLLDKAIEKGDPALIGQFMGNIAGVAQSNALKQIGEASSMLPKQDDVLRLE